MSLFHACTEEYVVGDPTYSFGFDSFESSSSTFLEDMQTIENAFKNAFVQELGVSVSDGTFTYKGGEAKVKAACEKAAQALKEKSIPEPSKRTEENHGDYSSRKSR